MCTCMKRLYRHGDLSINLHKWIAVNQYANEVNMTVDRVSSEYASGINFVTICKFKGSTPVMIVMIVTIILLLHVSK